MRLEVDDVCGGYGSGDVIRGVSCRADGGEILCLVGPNGCGKTTLFRLLLGALPLRRGEIRIDGKSIAAYSPRELARQIAYIPQSHTPVFSYSVLEVVLMGRASHLSALDAPRAADREAALEALARIHASHLAHQNYATLSGGQRQLVLIARAICQAAKIFVMDEPAANLDYANHQLLMSVIQDLARRGYLIVMYTNSPEHPASIGTRVLLLKEGQVAGFGPPDQVITPENLQAVYGIEMDVVTVLDRYGVSHTICLPVEAPR